MYNRQQTYQQPSPNATAQTLKLKPKSSWFYTDDYVEGTIELTTSVQIIINDINILITGTESWSTFSKEMNSQINEKQNLSVASINLDVKRHFKLNTNLIALKPGKFNFPFKFKLPCLIQPSFEFPSSEGKAYLRYILSANIISPYIKGNTQVYIVFKTRQKIEMNKQISFKAENNIHKWGLFDGGVTVMKITSINGTDNFKFGEDAKFNLNIDNTKGKLITSECKAVLRRFVVFRSKKGETTKTIEDKLVQLKIKSPAQPGENKDFPITLSLKNIENKNFNIKEQGLPYTNFGDINIFIPTMKSNLIQCYYNLKFTLYFDNFVKFDDRPRVTVNMIMCHQSMDELRPPANNNMNLNNNSIGMNNNNNNCNLNLNFNMNGNRPPNNTPFNRQYTAPLPQGPYPPGPHGPMPPIPGQQQGPPPMNRTFGNNNRPEAPQDFDLPSMEEVENDNMNNNNNNNNNYDYGDNNHGNNDNTNNNNYGDNNNGNDNYNEKLNNQYPEYPEYPELPEQ